MHLYNTPQDHVNNYTCTCVDKYVGRNCSTFDDNTSPQVDASSSISVIIIVIVIVLIAAIAAATAVIVFSVCVCLRKRKNRHVNITDNVAYHCSPQMMQIDETYAEISDPSITTSTNEAYGITHSPNDATTSQNETYDVIAHHSSGSGVRLSINEAYSSVKVPSQKGIKTCVNDAYIAVYDHELQLNEN